MDYTEYKSRVTSGFNNSNNIKEKDYLIEIFYEEKFELLWLATKLKMFSFISYSNIVKEDTIKTYSEICYEYARKNYKGMPRGFQNGFCSFSVLASENISKEAIDFAKKRPAKHFSAFEMPILYDLSKNCLYFYEETPGFGIIYYEFFRKYITNKFT